MKYLDFNSLLSSAMVQALTAVEFRVCDDIANAMSSTSLSTSVNTNNKQ